MPDKIEVAQAFVTIIPSLQGAQATITKELTGACEVAGEKAGAAAAKSLSEALTKAGKGMQSAGKTLSTYVTAPIVGVGTAAITSATNFDTAMAKLRTIADTTAVPVEDLTTQIKNLSTETGIASADIAEAAYGAISAGQDTAQAVNFVATAAKLAKGGFTDLSTATDVLTTALNAYGMSAEEVTKVSDILITTQNLGKTTVDELASSMGRVIPTASAAGIGIEDLASQYVTLTKNGIATAEATTYINSMINELSKGGTKASTAFETMAGKSFPDFIKSGGTTAEAMKMLSDSATEAGMSLGDVFGSAEASKAANVLANHISDSVTALQTMETQSGQTEAAFAIMSDTSAQKMAVLKNDVTNLAIALGDTVLPIISPIIQNITNGLQSITDKWNALSPGVQDAIVKMAGVAAVIGPVLSLGGKLTSGIGKVIGLIPSITGGISKVTGGLSSLASKATPAAAAGTSVAASFGTMAGQALLLASAAVAVFTIAEAMSVLVDSAISLAEAGPLAIGVFVGLAGIATGVTAAIVAIGSAATVSAVGLLAMGAAVLMVSGGIALIVASAALFTTQLPIIAEYGDSAATALLNIAEGLAQVTITAATSTAAVVALDAAFLAGAVSLGVFELAGVTLLAEMLLLDAELAVMAGATALVNASMTSIAEAARSAATDLKIMVSSIDIVSSGMDALKTKASDAVDMIKSIFSSGLTEVSNGLQSNCASIVSTFGDSMQTILDTGVSTLSKLAVAFATTPLRFNTHIALPHFSLNGVFDAKTKSVPYVNVTWYAQAAEKGAVFNSPQIVGVGDAPEPELLIGQNTLGDMIAQATQNSTQTAIESRILDIMERIADGGLKLGTTGRELALEINGQINSTRRAYG
ncbi:MAG: phage tail tape measure protein [Bacteroidales bacterium]|nr:phage tail tape measure protein [Bacteroidales bacterium]